MKQRQRKPTIEDVAEYCGVSVSTVSRVINKSSPVSAELNQQVENAIKELGFKPRKKASRFRSEKIGIIIPNVLNPSLAETSIGAQEEADRHGVHLAIFDVSDNPDFQTQRLEQLRKWSLDGLIVIGTTIPPEVLINFHEQNTIPIILSRLIEIPKIPCIMVDYMTATCQAVRYLLSLGHKRIACISGSPEWDSSKIKSEGVRRILSETGFPLFPHLYHWCFPNIEEGAQVTNNLLRLPKEKRPSAIIAFDDLIAIGALHEIQACGLKVPDDISVIGFNDIAMAAYTTPALTTISLPAYRTGQLLVKKLTELMKKRASASGGITSLKCSLIVRETTGPCSE